MANAKQSLDSSNGNWTVNICGCLNLVNWPMDFRIWSKSLSRSFLCSFPGYLASNDRFSNTKTAAGCFVDFLTPENIFHNKPVILKKNEKHEIYLGTIFILCKDIGVGVGGSGNENFPLLFMYWKFPYLGACGVQKNTKTPLRNIKMVPNVRFQLELL